MPGRKYNSAEYRYGFNGKEKDDEGEFGSITNYDYGFRIYNPAVGRFLSVDPLSPDYSMLTPYQYASNTPIAAIDIDGKEGGIAIVDEAVKVAKKIKTAYDILVQVVELAGHVANKVSDGINSLNEDIENGEDPKSISTSLFVEFAVGVGPEVREFNEGHPFTESLKNSRTTRIAIQKWLDGYLDFRKKKRPKVPSHYQVSWPDVDGSFPFLHTNETGPLREAYEDGGFTAAQFTGSAIYHFSYNEETGMLDLVVYDDKNLRSLTLHLVDDKHTRDEGRLFGKTIQIYHFSFSFEEIIKMVEVNIPEGDEEKPTGMGPHAGRSPSYPIPQNEE